MNPMRAHIERLIEAAEPTKDGIKAIEAQIYFKNNFIMPTPQGAKASNSMAGGVALSETPGVFRLLTVGTQPNPNGRGEHPVIVELLFQADDIFRLDRVVKHLEEQKIVPAGGSIISPH